MKSLISTGFKLPKKNILFSIGSFKEKQELLPSIAKLHELGYKIFATAGTADFIKEHGIPVHYLEVLSKDEDQKSEYNLSQHLANNLIDLYVNLPSANRFRRPASYMSKGYESRRMAVDYAVPLVTNVKNAKLLVEAIARNISLEVSNRDAQTSHGTAILPGLINITSFATSFDDFEQTTKESLAAGFTFNAFLPHTQAGASVTDYRSLIDAIDAVGASAYTDYSVSIAASETNSQSVSDAADNAGSLFLPFNDFANSKVSALTAQFSSWPNNKPIITDAKTTDLASVLLLASLYNRSIHITGVSSKEDLDLIKMAKEKTLQVTCDVAVHSLFLSKDELDYPFLPNKQDQEYLWENLKDVDCFSIGVLPYLIAKASGTEIAPGMGIKEAVPLLLTAVKAGKLTIGDIVSKFHDNPAKIFNLPKQDAQVVLDLDRFATVEPVYPEFSKLRLRGAVERVSFHNETVVLDGSVLSQIALGKNEVVPRSRFGSTAGIPESPRLGNKRVSFSSDMRRPSLAPETPEPQPAIFEKLGSELVSQPIAGSLGEIAALSDYIRHNNTFLRNNIISVKDITRSDLHSLFTVAQEMRLAVERQGVLDLLQGRVLATMFYEPSTRTSTSFDAAMQRLGGRVVAVDHGSSSVKKGETLQDTIRTLSCYSDAIVLRHPSEESADIAAKYSPVPIINAGNGTKEHPTQALLDLFTIREELGTVNGITVTFMGDLKYGRPVHSLCHLLRHYQVRVQLVAPKELQIPAEIRQQLIDNNMLIAESEELTKEILARSDVLYCTRVQEERFADKEQYQRLKDTYIVDNKILSNAKQHMCVMHPLPRTNEIREEVDFDQRAAYFRQMRHGLFIRMALLAMVVGVDF